MDHLIHILIPIAFFVVWVINALMNKEAPAPARNPLGGPRPGNLPPAPRPMQQQGPTLRFGQPNPPAASPPKRSVAVSDEVVILRNDSNRPRSVSIAGPRASASARKGPKPRQAPAPQPRKAEASPDRSVGTKVSQNVSQTLAITATQPNMTTMLGNQQPMAAAEVAHLSVPITSGLSATAGGVDFRPLFVDPARLREAFLINELLQPPLSVRDRRGKR